MLPSLLSPNELAASDPSGDVSSMSEAGGVGGGVGGNTLAISDLRSALGFMVREGYVSGV